MEQAEILCDEKWRPSIDLRRVKDDMVDMTQGFSFVKHAANGLQEEFLEYTKEPARLNCVVYPRRDHGTTRLSLSG
jgi:hypothetical protein